MIARVYAGTSRTACGPYRLSRPQLQAVPEQPEHRNDRRRFLVWACMLGVVPPQRVTERIVAEIERETAGAA